MPGVILFYINTSIFEIKRIENQDQNRLKRHWKEKELQCVALILFKKREKMQTKHWYDTKI